MDENDAITIIKDLREKLQGLNSNISSAFQTLLDQLENSKLIDKELVQTLKNHLGEDLVAKDLYKDVIEAIQKGSTVVYFKSAQLFKIYKKEELETLLSGHLRTVFKKINESYEIVPNDSKQKIIIMGEQSLVGDITHIKAHIKHFMQSKGISNFKEEDIVCFKNDSMLEIIINNYYVDNTTERDVIVKDLLHYIFQKDKNTNIVSKLGRQTFSDFAGAEMIPIPSGKQLLNSEFVEYVDTLVGNIEKCNKLDKNGNTYHINVQVIQNSTINSGTIDNSITTINEINASGNVYEFIKHIRTDKPSWYKEKTWVQKDVLYDEYRIMYDEVSKKAFSMMFKDKLYKMEKRQIVNKVRISMIKLFKFSDL